MSLIDSITPERIDFRIAGRSHYCDANGAHMAFGEDTLHHICNSFYMVREFQRGLGIQPAGDATDTPVGARCGCKKTVGYQTETGILIHFAGHTMEYLARTVDGVYGGWLHKWDGQLACIADSPQDYADLADAVLEWLVPYGIEPVLATED